VNPSLSLLFGFRERVPRRLYLQVGFGLMLLKYVVDAGIIAAATGRLWTPVDYLVPLLTLRSETVEALPAWLTLALVLWTLPFLWIGVSMTMRRAIDAGRSPWWCLAFFLPGLNYVVMIALSILPGAAHVDWDASPVRATAVRRLRSAGAGVVASIGIVLLAIVVGVFVLETYGLALFLATPFLVGVVTAYAYNRGHPRTFGETWSVVLLSLLMVGGTLILFALEGLLCILMAIPVGMLTALFGGAVGRAIAIRSGAPPPAVAYGLLLLPGTAVMDAVAPAEPVFEAVTAIEIDAPPERVWEAVVAFRDIEEAPGLPFRLGIAYPLRASITGTGVGAVRYCEFSTGSFVEPITAWDAPRRLSFDVAEQPPVLQEWSPYRNVYAPHVHGYFRSERGEFRLTPLPDGRTRLEGSTWYTLDIHPRPYWRWISEALLHRIHVRVLRQVQRQAESSPAQRAEASLAGPRGHAR
jgi:uncharacterized membrane protein YhaH (DUF805 family)